MISVFSVSVCKRKEGMEVLAPASVLPSEVHTGPHSKKPRLVFTDLQRRTLQAIFKVPISRIFWWREIFFADYHFL